MSSFDRNAPMARRRLFLAPLLLALGGCSFHPLYAPRGARNWDPDLAAIDVRPILDRPGQILALQLRENLNPSGLTVPKRWELLTTMTVARADLGIQRNATATTSEVTVSVAFQLREQPGGKMVYASSSRAVGDFDLVQDAYATQVAANSARDRAISQVADEMTLRLGLFVRDLRTQATTAR
jgi:LPS-assembly lipoprotein